MSEESGEPRHIKMDRYGWVAKQRKVSKKEKKLAQTEEEKEAERTQKWIDMFRDWDKFMRKNRKKVEHRVRKGIPDIIRQRAWQHILDIEELKKTSGLNLDELNQMERHEDCVTIDKDLSRTFPQIGLFAQPDMKDKLRTVLYAYCHADNEVGYTQGMSFLAGMFLAYMDVESAFFCFVSMMKGRLDQRQYFLDGFPRLTVANEALRLLMKSHCKKVLSRIENQGVLFPMFSPNWFMTAFQAYNWPPEMQLRIWERFLMFGTRALLSFGLTIILRHEDLLRKGGLEEILPILQRPEESPRMADWHEVFEQWDDLWLKKKEFERVWKQAEKNCEAEG